MNDHKAAGFYKLNIVGQKPVELMLGPKDRNYYGESDLDMFQMGFDQKIRILSGWLLRMIYCWFWYTH